jgi:hypothetical protein
MQLLSDTQEGISSTTYISTSILATHRFTSQHSTSLYIDPYPPPPPSPALYPAPISSSLLDNRPLSAPPILSYHILSHPDKVIINPGSFPEWVVCSLAAVKSYRKARQVELARQGEASFIDNGTAIDFARAAPR